MYIILGRCAHRRYRKKWTQDRISGNEQRWAGGSHAVNGDNDVAKMHSKKGNALVEIARTGH